MNSRHARHFFPYAPLLGALLAGILFAVLMAFRLGLFQSTPGPVSPSPAGVSAKDSWMTIWQSERKIGYNHRRLFETGTGYRLTDRTVMRINTMGLVQDIDLETTADLHPDLSLSSFDVTLASSRFSFSVQGRVTGGALYASTEAGEVEIALEAPPYLSAGLWDAAAVAALAPGQSMAVLLFDPVSMGNHTVQVTFEGREAVGLPDGEPRAARKFSVAFMGAVETAWLDDQGGVLKEEGLLGITLVKDSRENALDTDTLSGSEDLTLAASVSAGMRLEAPDMLTRLELKVDGLPSSLRLDGGRQAFSEGILTIVRETLPDPPEISAEGETDFLAATPFIQSDHPEIAAAAHTATGGARRPLPMARNLVAWVHDTLHKRPVLSVPTALETLRQGTGDCNEHAVLLAALARAAGIPARVEAGLVYMDGRFYYHAWNSLYLGRWVTADALMNQMPTDVTHIRLVQGGTGDQADILGAIGNIRIKIVSSRS